MLARLFCLLACLLAYLNSRLLIKLSFVCLLACLLALVRLVCFVGWFVCLLVVCLLACWLVCSCDPLIVAVSLCLTPLSLVLSCCIVVCFVGFVSLLRLFLLVVFYLCCFVCWCVCLLVCVVCALAFLFACLLAWLFACVLACLFVGRSCCASLFVRWLFLLCVVLRLFIFACLSRLSLLVAHESWLATCSCVCPVFHFSLFDRREKHDVHHCSNVATALIRFFSLVAISSAYRWLRRCRLCNSLI